METKETILEKRMKKSDLKAAGIFDFEYLTRNVQGLLSCKLYEDGEDVIWKFDIASICMSVVTIIFSIQRFFSERKELKQKNEKREKVYSDYLVRIRKYIRQRRQEERAALNWQVPEIHELQRMATEYDSRLYERSLEDEDFLQVSLGFQSGESKVKVEYNKDELRTEEDELSEEALQVSHDFETIHHIPVTVNLRKEHLGIVGETEYLHNQLKYLLAQICFFHSYHDLQIVFISNEAYEKEFSYLKWYPHLKIQAINIIAGIFTDSVRDQVLGSILQVVKERKQKIKSELARRQRIFNEFNVNHINGYHKLYKLGKVSEPIPHLFLISDEFAELKKEQPEFMKELVSTARIGRSLGIHLILATQKPSGVVDEQIWTNSKFKLCLKVQNEADSREMLKTPDAASITQPGRAYLQVGNNEIYELFQSAFSGGAYSDEEEKKEGDMRVYLVNSLGQGQLINQDLSGSMESNQIRKTELDVIVDHIGATFESLQIPKIKSPWLPPLEAVMVSPYLNHIEDSAIYTQTDLKVSVGLEDIPNEQRQAEYEIDLLHNGHVIFFASAGYGKTVFLSTLLLSLCVKNSVQNLNAYILDFGNNALLPMKALPQVADYITYDDVEKQQKLWRLLAAEMRERKQLMSSAMAQNFEIYNQTAGRKLKALLVLIDNYDVVKELGIDEGFFVQLARDGANLGIYLAITASRSSVVKYALMNQIKIKIAGYNYEPMEPRNIVGRSEYELPEIKGRTLVKSDAVNLMQVYCPTGYETAMEYNRNLLALIKRIAETSSEEKAKGIAVLPEQFYLNMLSEYETGETADVYLGLEKQQVRKFGIVTADTPFLIVGPVRSGKSNAGRTVLNQLQEFKKVYLFDARDYEFQDMENRENVAYVNSPEVLQQSMDELADLIEVRKENCAQERGRMTVRDFYRTLDKYCVFINGLEDFTEFIGDKSDVIQLLLRAAETGILIVMTGHSAHMPVRNETAKLVKAAEYGLILGDAGMNTPFPAFRGRELPERVEDGLLFKKGTSVMLRLPKA